MYLLSLIHTNDDFEANFHPIIMSEDGDLLLAIQEWLQADPMLEMDNLDEDWLVHGHDSLYETSDTSAGCAWVYFGLMLKNWAYFDVVDLAQCDLLEVSRS